MKNKILIALICFLLLPISVFAGGKNDDGGNGGNNGGSAGQNSNESYCVYNNITITIYSSNVVITDYKNVNNPYFDGSRDDFIDQNGKLYCPNMLYSHVVYQNRVARTELTFHPKDNNYGKIMLTDPHIISPRPDPPSDPTVKVNCSYLFGDPKEVNQVAYWMQWTFNLMKYLGIIALFVMSTVDFVKALVQNDQDGIKKAATTSIKRFILCVLLFFLPIIVEILMSFLGAYGTCNIG